MRLKNYYKYSYHGFLELSSSKNPCLKTRDKPLLYVDVVEKLI